MIIYKAINTNYHVSDKLYILIFKNNIFYEKSKTIEERNTTSNKQKVTFFIFSPIKRLPFV